MKTPYDKLTEIDTNCSGHIAKIAYIPMYGKNCSGHIAKIAYIPIYGKNPLKYSSPEQEG